MHVTIVGTGHMARALAIHAQRGGHTATLLGRRGKAEALDVVRGLGEGISAGALGDPLVGDLVVLAVHHPAVADVLARYGDEVAGMTLVDISNPLNETGDGLLEAPAGSAAQETAAAAPGAVVVKGFNHTFASTIELGEVAGMQIDVLIAGDDAEGKAKVAEFARTGGMRPIDAGSLARARELEALGFLHIAIQPSLGAAFASIVKFVA
jgi:8-hydroxy-5-deazaflavin:NADPH oxidoreductase